MKLCSSCGQGIEDQARFCSHCGHFQAHSGNLLERALDIPERVDSWSRRLWPLWLSLILLGTAAFIGAIFFFLGKSEPARMSLKVLRESPAVRQAVGDIQDLGWPSGGMSTRSGGTGTANFTVSVKGSLAKGKFYAYFIKRHDVWHYESGRLRLDDGRSIDIPSPP